MEWTGSIRWIHNPVQSRRIWIGWIRNLPTSLENNGVLNQSVCGSPICQRTSNDVPDSQTVKGSVVLTPVEIRSLEVV